MKKATKSVKPKEIFAGGMSKTDREISKRIEQVTRKEK